MINMGKLDNSKSIDTNVTDTNYQIFLIQLRNWLSFNHNTPSFFQTVGKVLTTRFRYQISDKTKFCEEVPGEIILIQQYFLHEDPNRRKEIQQSLKYNNGNKQIDKIILLNERIYSDQELGISSSKIVQIDISERLTYKKVFEYIQQLGDDKYIVLSNADIFFDATLNRIKKAGLTKEHKAFSLLRYEYKEGTSLKNCKLFGPRPDSQDSWIWHNKWKFSSKFLNILNFKLGTPGCDNKFIYCLNILGFACYNEPSLIKTYHHHSSLLRNQNKQDLVKEPYYTIFPILSNEQSAHNIQTFDIIRENKSLFDYLTNKMKEDKPFIIPRISSVENEVAVLGAIAAQGTPHDDLLKKIPQMISVMKTNAGISVKDLKDFIVYSKHYLSAFEKCERYGWWEPWGNYVQYIPQSFDFMVTNFDKPKIDSITFDILQHINRNPWTFALRGKRILIISGFIESIKDKIPIKDKIYGIDLFPECTFVFLKPPQTQAGNPSRHFQIELNELIQNIKEIKDTFDIALCACGGYSNPICAAIYDMDKSAIYVGGVLQMFFGIYGQRWLKERPDIMRMYLNKHWSRPKKEERPINHMLIETGCYW